MKKTVYFNPDMNQTMNRLPSVIFFPEAERCVVPASPLMRKYHEALSLAEQHTAMSILNNKKYRKLMAEDSLMIAQLETRNHALKQHIRELENSAWKAFWGKVWHFVTQPGSDTQLD